MQFKQHHMSVRPTVTRPYHNQPSLQSMWRLSMCFESLFLPSIWLSANIHTLVKQNIQIETAVRLGGHSLINSELTQWEHSDFVARDELLLLSTQKVTMVSLALNNCSDYTVICAENVPYCHMKLLIRACHKDSEIWIGLVENKRSPGSTRVNG